VKWWTRKKAYKLMVYHIKSFQELRCVIERGWGGRERRERGGEGREREREQWRI
jgi:hypothetical protein